MVLIYIYYVIITKQETLHFPHTSHTHMFLETGSVNQLQVHWWWWCGGQVCVKIMNTGETELCLYWERWRWARRQMGIITTVKLSGEIRRDLPDKSGSSLCWPDQSPCYSFCPGLIVCKWGVVSSLARGGRLWPSPARGGQVGSGPVGEPWVELLCLISVFRFLFLPAVTRPTVTSW